MNANASEVAAVVGVVNPADLATSAVSTDWVAAANFFRFLAVVQAGALTGTLDAKFEQATTSSGGGAKDVTGRAITQLADSDDNVQALINLKHDDLDIANGFDYVRLTLTPTGGTTNLGAAVLLGFNARSNPASANDSTTVEEVV